MRSIPFDLYPTLLNMWADCKISGEAFMHIHWLFVMEYSRL